MSVTIGKAPETRNVVLSGAAREKLGLISKSVSAIHERQIRITATETLTDEVLAQVEKVEKSDKAPPRSPTQRDSIHDEICTMRFTVQDAARNRISPEELNEILFGIGDQLTRVNNRIGWRQAPVRSPTGGILEVLIHLSMRST